MSGSELTAVDELLASIGARWGDTYGLRTGEPVRCFVGADQHGRWQLFVTIWTLPVRVAGMYSLPDRGGLQPSLAAFLEDMGNERI